MPLAPKRRASATRSAKSQRFGATPRSPRSRSRAGVRLDRKCESTLSAFAWASVPECLAHLDLLAEHQQEKLERAAVRWCGRLETEATFLPLSRSSRSPRWRRLCCGERDAIEVLGDY